MPLQTGVIAALSAPLFEAVGFLEWDYYWSRGGGSAFALNMYKCILASFGFYFMMTYATNEAYMKYSIDSIENDPWGYTAQNVMSRTGPDTNIPHHRKLLKSIPFWNNSTRHLQQSNVSQNNVQLQQQQKQQQQQLESKSNNMNIRPHDILGAQPNLNTDPTSLQSQNPDPRFPTPRNQDMTQSMHASEYHQHTNESPHFESRPNNFSPPGNAQNQNNNVNNINMIPLVDTGSQSFSSDPSLPDRYRYPFEGQTHKIHWLLISSFLGIIVGDCAELEALRLIGARRVLVVDTIKPFAAAILGNLLLNEPLYVPAFIGMIFAAYGVYIVLVASIEKLEQVKDKQKESKRKRLGSNNDIAAFLSQGDGTTENSIDADKEVAAIVNQGIERNIQMVGMRRRPLSRHDLMADYEDAEREVEDDLMLLLEDGRGIINSTICCDLNRSNSGESSGGGYGMGMRRRTGSWASSDSSWGNHSWGDIGGLHEHDLDSMLDDKEKEDDSDSLSFFFEEDVPPPDPDKNKTPGMSEKDTDIERSELVSIALPSQETGKEKPIKSALKKSRFGSTNMSDGDKNSPTNVYSSTSSIPIPIVAPKKQRQSSNTKRGRSRSPLSHSESTRSFVSVESEHGPPLGTYTGKRRETKTERVVRIRTGYVLATTNVLLDTYAAYLTKKHAIGMSTWEINLCRFAFAGFFMFFISSIMRLVEYRQNQRQKDNQDNFAPTKTSQSYENEIVPWYRLPRMSKKPWAIVSIGVFFVTFLSPALSFYSLMEIPMALSVSLTAITPLYTMPLGICMRGDWPTKRSCLGALVSVVGVVILCLWGVDASNLD